jgi:sialidase-1
MELRNSDEIFKYTLSSTDAVTPGKENIIAFSADSTEKTYKLYANGALIATLSKSEYVFLDDITGLNKVTLGDPEIETTINLGA